MKWQVLFVKLFLLIFATNAHCQLFDPPQNPSPPPFITNTTITPNYPYLPIVITNDSRLPDDQVYFVITGSTTDTLPQPGFVSFDANGIGTFVLALSGDNATNYAKPFSDFPTYPGALSNARVCYLPYINSALTFFSLNQPLNMPVNSQNRIVEPSPSASNDPNYLTRYQTFEFVYLPQPSQISANLTAIAYFSLPIYAFISTPEINTRSNTGLYQPRHFIMSSIQNQFALNAFPQTLGQWNNLFLKDSTQSIIRVLGSGQAMSVTASTPSTTLFDLNYLDNASTYGFSYLEDLWYGVHAYYKLNSPLIMSIPAGSFATYSGVIQPDNTILFTSTTTPYQIVFGAPTTTHTLTQLTTTEAIFEGQLLTISDNSPTGEDGQQLSKLFEEAVIAGLLPLPTSLTNPLSNLRLISLKNDYYKINSNLFPLGKTTGPWYDLYSKALHDLGSIYTYSFDEPLWPDVQIGVGTIQPTTYLGLTLCPCIDFPTTTTLISVANPSSVDNDVTFIATVVQIPQNSIPTGKVAFSINGAIPILVNLDANGNALFQTSFTSAGTNTITATYFGNDQQSSATIDQIVASVSPTTTQLTTPQVIYESGNPILLNARVLSAKLPVEGIVTFVIDGEHFAAIPLKNEQATFSIGTLPLGIHSFQAIYSGDASHESSISNSVIVEVIPSTKVATVTTLQSSNLNAIEGIPITFTATVSGTNEVEPTGTVLFIINGIFQEPVIALNNGQASYSTFLAAGNYTIQAFYNGNAIYRTSISNPIAQIVFGSPSMLNPPSRVKGIQIKNKFATQTNRINILTWNAPLTGSLPSGYQIYGDHQLTQLLATIPAHSSSTYEYRQTNQKNKTQRYYLVSVDLEGNYSSPVEVIVKS